MSTEPELAVDVAEKADIICLENYLTLDSQEFAPIDFNALHKRGTRFIVHYHSSPDWIHQKTRIPYDKVVKPALPSMVIAQFHERYYPESVVVPNLFEIDHPLYRPVSDPMKHDIIYTPSWLVGAWADRWNTKGEPETRVMLNRLQQKHQLNVQIINQRPHEEVLALKQRSRIVLDEMVTGSYHLSGMEGLSMGKPVLAYLDERTQRVLREISGADDQPFVNIGLEGAARVLSHLIESPALCDELGDASRQWIEKYWADRVLIQQYIALFEGLLENPASIKRQPALSLEGERTKFHAVTLPDIIHETRKKCSQTVGWRMRVLASRLKRKAAGIFRR